jgi:hypothetical protein
MVDAMLATDTTGRTLFQGNDATPSLGLAASSGSGTLAGLPAYFSQGVSGKYWRQGDQTQVVTINGTPTGGTFRLFSGGNQTTSRSTPPLRRCRPRSARGAASTPA